jgi:hypothetical protein
MKKFFRLRACLFSDVGWAALRVRGWLELITAKKVIAANKSGWQNFVSSPTSWRGHVTAQAEAISTWIRRLAAANC